MRFLSFTSFLHRSMNRAFRRSIVYGSGMGYLLTPRRERRTVWRGKKLRPVALAAINRTVELVRAERMGVTAPVPTWRPARKTVKKDRVRANRPMVPEPFIANEWQRRSARPAAVHHTGGLRGGAAKSGRRGRL